MRYETAFFNPGIAKNLLRRYWPLWTLYLIGLLIALPVGLMNLQSGEERARWMLNAGMVLVYGACAIAPLPAWAAFGFLYNSRSCGMMTCMPVRREALFVTEFLTVLLPFLACDGLIALMLLPFCNGVFTAGLVGQWFLLLVLSQLAFYGFGVFCAQLTGNALILPFAYYALMFAAPAAEGCLKLVIKDLSYGYSYLGAMKLKFLSPPFMFSGRLYFSTVYTADFETLTGFELHGLGVLAIYAAVGIAFSAAALLLFRRRRMETAGDTVALTVLKPVFRCCMAVGGALAWDALVMDTLFYGMKGRLAAGVSTLLLLMGACLGWFVAEMKIRRTVRVFREKKAALWVICGALVLGAALLEADAFGMEQYIPEASQVKELSLYAEGRSLDIGDPEDEVLEQTFALHRQLISDKKQNEASRYGNYVRVSYLLSDGRSIEREYRVADIDALLGQLETVMNSRQAIESRLPDGEGLRARDVQRFEIYTVPDYYEWDVSGELSASDFLAIYAAMQQDRDEGHLGRVSLQEDADAESIRYKIWASVEFNGRPMSLEVEIGPEAVHTLELLETLRAEKLAD